MENFKGYIFLIDMTIGLCRLLSINSHLRNYLSEIHELGDLILSNEKWDPVFG